jgi:hypothetical protein
VFRPGRPPTPSNVQFGFGGDERDYRVAPDLLRAMGVRSVRLISNNPDKIADLERNGIPVRGRIPVEIPANKYDASYLDTKRDEEWHLFDEIPDAAIGRADRLHASHEQSRAAFRGGAVTPRNFR